MGMGCSTSSAAKKPVTPGSESSTSETDTFCTGKGLVEHTSSSTGSVLSHPRLRQRYSSFQENLVSIRTTPGYNIRNEYTGVDDTAKGLGSGLTGSVRRVVRKSDGAEFAMKVIRLNKLTPDLVDVIRSEVLVLRQLDHPHIPRLYEAYEETGCNLYFVMELCRGGDLFKRLQAARRFAEPRVALYMRAMLSAVYYVHAKGIVHRDIKPRNFVFSEEAEDDPDGMPMLIDFGLSKEVDVRGGGRMEEAVGSIYYMAPEVISSPTYTAKCDLWSLGVICYVLLTGRPPFYGDDQDAIIEAACACKYEWGPRASKRVSSAAKDFVAQLLVLDTEKRLSAEEALHHEWLSDANIEALQRAALESSGGHDDKGGVAPTLGDANMGNSRRRRSSIDTDEAIQRFQKFSKFSEMKRAAILAVAHSLSSDEIADLRLAFQEMDSDHDGFLTIAELRDAIERRHAGGAAAGGIGAEQLQQLFNMMDESHTGHVELSHFVAAALEERYYNDEARLRRAFAQLDTDNTGFISIDNLRDVIGREFDQEAAEHMIEAFDLSGDHEISYEEFLLVMRTEGEAVSPPPPSPGLASPRLVALAGQPPDSPSTPHSAPAGGDAGGDSAGFFAPPPLRKLSSAPGSAAASPRDTPSLRSRVMSFRALANDGSGRSLADSVKLRSLEKLRPVDLQRRCAQTRSPIGRSRYGAFGLKKNGSSEGREALP